MSKTHVMIDLETLGTTPGSAVIAIGACVFNPDHAISLVGERTYFHDLIDVATCERAGLTVDESTVRWWQDQPGPNTYTWTTGQDPAPEEVVSLGRALAAFSTWLGYVADAPRDLYVWGNGATFDLVLLGEAYRACGFYVPWTYRNERCFRTLRQLAGPERVRQTHDEEPVAHHALTDARQQATQAVKLMALLGLTWG